MKKEDINKRFVEAINYLITNKIVESKTILAANLEIKPAKFSEILNYRMNIGTDLAGKICDLYNINSNWLLTGKGSMLQNTIIGELSNDPSVGVPYYDVDFAAGFGDMMNDQTILPTNNIVFAPFRDATCWCNVTGHSMEPRINHGDIIALKECTVNDIQYGEIYAVVLDTFRTIKILRKSSDPDKFLFVPINKDYDEQEFDKSRILKIYGVMGAISKFF